MEAEQFDQLARWLVRGSTRRVLLSALLAALPGTLGLPADDSRQGQGQG